MEKNPAEPDGLDAEYMRLVRETPYTLGPWFVGPTPRYLMMNQQADGQARKSNPLTIRSPHHSEEIATVWNYLLPTEGNANLIAAALDLLYACEAEWLVHQHMTHCEYCIIHGSPIDGFCPTGTDLVWTARTLREAALAKTRGSNG